MNNSAGNTLDLMGIVVFNADGTPKGTSELIKEMQEKCERLANEIKNGEKTPNQVRKEYGLPPIEGGDLKVIGNCIYKGYIDNQPNEEKKIKEQGGVYLKDVIYDLGVIRDAVIYEIGDATACGLQNVVNSLRQAILKIDICIYNLKNIDEDFEDRVCEINKAIDVLKEAINKVIEIEYTKDTLSLIKEEIGKIIDELKRFDEIYNVSEDIEPIDKDYLEEDKEETTANYVKRINVTKLYEDATPIANKIVGILANEDINFYTAEKVIELVERGIKTLKLKK